MARREIFVCDAPVVDVYIATIPENVQLRPVLPKRREEEIQSCSNIKVQRQKYAAWKLLEYALERSFGLSLAELELVKTERGKWQAKACCFSITHCDEVVAVALSKEKVGVDVEKRSEKLLSASRRFLTEQETLCLQTLKESEKLDYLACKWTQKESIFKAFDEGAFAPLRIETSEYKTQTKSLPNGYVISVATERPEGIRWHEGAADLKFL